MIWLRWGDWGGGQPKRPPTHAHCVARAIIQSSPFGCVVPASLLRPCSGLVGRLLALRARVASLPSQRAVAPANPRACARARPPTPAFAHLPSATPALPPLCTAPLALAHSVRFCSAPTFPLLLCTYLLPAHNHADLYYFRQRCPPPQVWGAAPFRFRPAHGRLPVCHISYPEQREPR